MWSKTSNCVVIRETAKLLWKIHFEYQILHKIHKKTGFIEKSQKTQIGNVTNLRKNVKKTSKKNRWNVGPVGGSFVGTLDLQSWGCRIVSRIQGCFLQDLLTWKYFERCSIQFCRSKKETIHFNTTGGQLFDVRPLPYVGEFRIFSPNGLERRTSS